MNNSRLTAMERRMSYIVSFLVSLVVLGLCSVTTSPLFKDCYTEFNNNFSVSAQLVGKAMLEGKIPYKDLCGAEGIIYYLIQALGYLLGGRTGIYIFQVISLCVALCIIYRISRKFLGVKSACAVSVLILYVSAAAIGSGNSSMEFSMPFFSAIILILVDLALKSEDSGSDKKVMVKLSFFVGIMMAVLIFMTFRNVTMVLLLTGSFFYLLEKGKRTACVMPFLGGAALISIPILIALSAVGALPYYLQDGVLLHMEALKVGNGTANEMVRKIIKNTPLILIFFTAVLNKNADLRKLKRVTAGISAVLFFTMLAGHGYWHYYICIIPLLYFGFMPGFLRENAALKTVRCICFAGAVAVLYMTPVKNNMKTIVDSCISHEYEYDNLAAAQWYEDFITEDKTVITVDVSPAFYLVNDYIPDYRLFANQTWFSRIAARYSDEIQKSVYENDYTYLLVGSSGMVSEAYGNYEITQMVNIYRTAYVYELHADTEDN